MKLITLLKIGTLLLFLPQESILTLINFLLQKLEIIVIVVKVIKKFYIEIQNQMKRHLPI